MHFIWLSLCVLSFTRAHAQVNIEQYRSDDAVTSTIGVSGGGATGNSEFFATGATIGLAFRDSTHSLLLLGDGLIGFAGGKSFSNDGLLHLRYTRVRHRRLQPEAFTQSDYDTQRLLSFRYLVGGGLRTVLVGGKKTPVYLGTALMYEHERLDLETTAAHARTTSLLRGTSYIDFRVGGDDEWSFSATAYYQPKLSDFSDQRVLVSASMSNKLIGPLSQTVTLKFRRDSRPPDDTEPNDLGIGFGIEWRSGK